MYSIRTHSAAALIEMDVPPAQLYTTALGQGGKIAVDFIPEGDVGSELRFGTVPLRFIPTSRLGVDGWRTLHLAINCHFDPLPHKYCQHSGPCEHREKPSDVDQTSKPSVRSWQGKRDDYALSEPLPSAAELRRSSQVHMIGGGRRSDLRGGNRMSGTTLAAATGRGGGPRQAYGEGTRSAFYSSTRTPNPHVGGDGQLSPYAWKTSLLWAEASRHRGDDGSDEVLLWEPACCLDQEQASRRNVDAVRYAESVLAALEAVEMLWVHGACAPHVHHTSLRTSWLHQGWHCAFARAARLCALTGWLCPLCAPRACLVPVGGAASSGYSDSLYTVLELVAWQRLKKIHPSNTVLLNATQVSSIAGRAARLPLFDAARDHARWLRSQLRKHGSPGRAYVATFLERLGIDLRDPSIVREAFAALGAIGATQQREAQQGGPGDAGATGRHHTEAVYRPTDRRRKELVPETAQWDYGWIDNRAVEARPRVGQPPLSKWHPGPTITRDFLKPGLVSDLHVGPQARGKRVQGD